MRVSVVIPALNEEKTVGACVKKALRAIEKLGVSGEVVVADNGSSDATARAAVDAGARVVHVARKGYGHVCMGGLRAARGELLVLGDADESYDFLEIGPFVEKMEQGYDFVMGNRFRGRIEEGAMPPLHRHLGTPVLTFLMNLLFRAGIGDTNCGLRGLTKRAFEKMHLKAGGMEFATEMVIKASTLRMKIADVPCNLYRDKRGRKPHLRTWADGWRHLRFILLFKANAVFFVPGAAFFVAGVAGMALLSASDFVPGWGPIDFIGKKHLLSFMALSLLGAQVFMMGVAAQAFTFSQRFDRSSRVIRLLTRHFNLEKGLGSGVALCAASTAAFAYLLASFLWPALPRLSDAVRFDMAVFGIAFFMFGMQIVFASFLLSLFYLKLK